MSLKKKNNKLDTGKNVKRSILVTFLILSIFIAIRVSSDEDYNFSLNNLNSLVKKDALVISGVRVNDFTKEIENPNEKSYITLSQNGDYHIFYIPSQTLFYITISSSPFDQQKDAAEKEFLEKLGITSEAACKLNVDVATPANVNPSYAGQIYHLSFCE